MSQELKLLKDQPPEDPVAALQEELAAAKVREAEAVMSLKELQQTVSDLNVMWKRHLEVRGAEMWGSGFTGLRWGFRGQSGFEVSGLFPRVRSEAQRFRDVLPRTA